MLNKIPENDQEAERMLSEGRTANISRELIALYRVEREQGQSIVDAFRAVLKRHIVADERALAKEAAFGPHICV